MKHYVGVLCLLALTTVGYGQGVVKFANNVLSPVSLQSNVMPANDDTLANTFYFALLCAPVGETDPTHFNFAGVYGTNTATAGRFRGGPFLGSTCNNAWPIGADRSFLAVGWSANNGPVWNPAWFEGASSGFTGWLGWSSIATGTAGGVDPISGQTYAPLAIFSDIAIATGFMLSPVPIPEPTSLALGLLGSCFLAVLRRRKSSARPSP